MRTLGDYDLADWSRLRPLTHAYKTALYRLATARHVRRSAPGTARMVETLRQNSLQALAISVAFEAPWAIERQIRAARRNLADTLLMVCDNSRSAEAARDIEAICARAETPYFRLPRDRARGGSRSHAMAINWAYRNLVCPAQPSCFAFLDHDLFPIRPVSLARLVERQPVYGLRRTAGERWFLWAGLCVFEARFAHQPVLDFSQDWFNGLDTGGANYRLLYQSLDASTMDFASYQIVQRAVPDAGEEISVELIDEWLHLTNVSGWDRDQRRDPAVLARIVDEAIGG